VTITSAPGDATATDSAQIGFIASEVGVSFACKLDGAAYSACVSPAALTGLAAGQHTFAVRATDKAGNVGQDAIATWTYTPPDTTPPVVTITAAPSSSTTETEASFSFAANEDGATFACALDGGAVSACTSPVSYAGLGVGSHSFSAQATDKAGNTGAAATHAWEIVPPLPDLYVSAFTKFTLTVTNRGQAAAGRSILTITSIGTFGVPALEAGQSVTVSWSICRPGTYAAVVDRTDVVKESDEGNNTAALDNACP
jgi:hypothetical protein